MKKTGSTSQTGTNNIVDKIPRGYTLFTGKDIYRDGDVIEIGKDTQWAVLSGSSYLVRKKMEIKHEVPVYRKGKK